MSSAYTVRETASYYANRLQSLRDHLLQPDYKRKVVDVLLIESAMAFLSRVARDDLSIFAGEPDKDES